MAERNRIVGRKSDLIRSLPTSIARAGVTERADGDGQPVLFGYAAVFDKWATINSVWEGHFRERIKRGAFAKTLRESGDSVKVLFNHGFDPNIGDKPLGKPRVQREDDRGLYVEVPLVDTSYNRDLTKLLRAQALDGMSIRFSVFKDSWNKDTPDGIPERTISELRLYEYGPVTFPAYAATAAGIRTLEEYKKWVKRGGADPHAVRRRLLELQRKSIEADRQLLAVINRERVTG